MPKLTEVMESGATNAPDAACPRCGRRKVAVYINCRMLRRFSVANTPGPDSARRVSLRNVSGLNMCRKCGDEIVDKIEQLLGVNANEQAR